MRRFRYLCHHTPLSSKQIGRTYLPLKRTRVIVTGLTDWGPLSRGGGVRRHTGDWLYGIIVIPNGYGKRRLHFFFLLTYVMYLNSSARASIVFVSGHLVSRNATNFDRNATDVVKFSTCFSLGDALILLFRHDVPSIVITLARQYIDRVPGEFRWRDQIRNRFFFFLLMERY